MFSLVIPVYRNESSIAALVEAVSDMNRTLSGNLEAVFVIDGSPDRSFELLRAALPGAGFRSKLVLHSRNFGSFPAIVTGLREASGPHFAVMAADLQEPPQLILDSFRSLETDEADVVIGTRDGRTDPFFSRLSSDLFWSAYRRFVQPEMPPGGVDIFACSKDFRDTLLKFEESHSSLIGQIFWVGYRRRFIGYRRLKRHSGRSAWTFARKLAYLGDSVFAFSNLPIRVLTAVGSGAILVSLILGLTVLLSKLTGGIPVPGYAATVLTVMFFAGINTLGLGIIGSYTWRTYENTKRRPLAIPMRSLSFEGRQ